MANTFTQIHLHVVFAVQNRLALIDESWRERLHKYLVAIVQKHNHKVLAIGGMADHVHVLLGMRPAQALSDLMRELKRDSSEWINQNDFARGHFAWQEGYGAFSYGKSQLPTVINYIKNQPRHHAQRDFDGEFRALLDRMGIEYDDRYIFKKPVY